MIQSNVEYVDVTPLQLVQIASEFLDDAWNVKFPIVGDWITVSDITDGLDNVVMVGHIDRIVVSPDNHRMIRIMLTSRSKNNFNIDIYPSQIVSCLYMIKDRCFSIGVIGKPKMEEDQDGDRGIGQGGGEQDQAQEPPEQSR